MASALDPSTNEAIQERLRFYRDLGLTEFYRRPVNPALLAKLASAAGTAPEALLKATPVLALELNPEPKPVDSPPVCHPERARRVERPALSAPDREGEEPGASGLASETWGATSLPSLPQVAATANPTNPAEALQFIRDEIGDCTRCKLHTGRNKLVYGDGDPNARLMFVGEGPGADEDAQGLPFVGKAGQLLNNMISAMGLRRDQVYIANVVKCRPPGNRVPEPDEGNTCSPFLLRQIDAIRPEVLVALGATAATYLLGQRQPLAGLRGRVHSVLGTKLIVTYHPAFLLRDPRQKKEAWADLQIAMRELGLKPPSRG